METYALVLALFASDGSVERHQLYSGLPEASCVQITYLAAKAEALPSFANLVCVPEREA